MFFLAAHIRPCYLTSSGILLSSFLDNSRRSCRKGRALLELRLAEQTADVRAIIKTMQTTVLGFILFLAKKRNKKILCKSSFSYKYSRIAKTRTLKENEKQFELVGNSRYRGKFQWKGKEIWFELTGNSGYPSSSYRCSTVPAHSPILSDPCGTLGHK